MAPRRNQKPPRHTDSDVRKVVKAAIDADWYVEHPGSHAWGWLVCGGEVPLTGECRITVLSTPRGSAQAKVLRRALAKCPHGRAVAR